MVAWLPGALILGVVCGLSRGRLRVMLGDCEMLLADPLGVASPRTDKEHVTQKWMLWTGQVCSTSWARPGVRLWCLHKSSSATAR